MTITYKTDNSFFTHIKIPMSWYGVWELRYWFQTLGGYAPKYRMIIDEELDEARLDLKRRDEYYPGTRSIGIVMNPWARIRSLYVDLQIKKDPRADMNFTEFVKIFPKSKDVKFNHWWHPLDQQIRWLEYQTEDGSVRRADYIFHAERLKEEFCVIQDYFECYEPLPWWTPLPEYKEFYNDETKAIIADLFAEDIERLDYTFEN
jgi:hypothetical protein